MVIVSVADSVPSDTVRVKVIVPAEDGAVNVGFWAMLFDNVTDGPAVLAQVYVRESPFGSVPEPLKVTKAPATTDWLEPAFAVGA